jgi:hypothetical protein
MFVLENYSQLSAAAARAAKVPNLKCRVVDFGEYDVTGTSGTTYRVSCKKMADGTRIVWCSCEERFPRKTGQICYHVIPAIGAHVILAIAKRSVILADV